MKAMGMERHGDASELRLLDLERPVPSSHQVLVRVVCSSVNPADIRARAPSAQRVIPRTFPLVLGYDVSGVVESVGDSVRGFAVGDAVFGSPALTGQGANAEYVVVDYRSLCHKPTAWSHAQAAALSLAGVTALECLDRAAACDERRCVLVHAGAGGVGHLQIQLARALGWRVWATAGNPDSMALCHRLGAERVINYREEDFVAVCLAEAGHHGMPTIMDNVGGEVFAKSMEALSPLGTLVSIVPSPHPAYGGLFAKAATLIYHVMGAASLWGVDPAAQGQALSRLVHIALEHEIVPTISHRWKVRDLAQAHRQVETGRTVGKVVVDVEDGWS